MKIPVFFNQYTFIGSGSASFFSGVSSTTYPGALSFGDPAVAYCRGTQFLQNNMDWYNNDPLDETGSYDYTWRAKVTGSIYTNAPQIHLNRENSTKTGWESSSVEIDLTSAYNINKNFTPSSLDMAITEYGLFYLVFEAPDIDDTSKRSVWLTTNDVLLSITDKFQTTTESFASSPRTVADVHYLNVLARPGGKTNMDSVWPIVIAGGSEGQAAVYFITRVDHGTRPFVVHDHEDIQ